MYVKNNDRLLTIQRRFNLNEVIVYLLQNWQVYDQVKRENLLFRHEKQSWKRWGRGVSLNVSMTDGWGLSFWQHLSFLQGRVHVFVLLKLLQLGLDQNLSDVHHLLHGESQALHRVTELLLRGKRHHHHQPATSCASGQGMQTVATTSEMNEICSQGDKHQVNTVMIKSPKIQPDRVRQLKKWVTDTRHAERWWKWKRQLLTVLWMLSIIMTIPMMWKCMLMQPTHYADGARPLV